MRFYDDFCRDARDWLSGFGHDDAVRLPLRDVGPLYYQVIHQLPTAEPRAFQRSRESIPVLTAMERKGLAMLRQEVEQGISLIPRMSKGVRRNHHDPLYSDWRISHFHLGVELDRRGFFNRTKHTAFAYIDQEAVRMLAVWPHVPRPYEDIRLLEILQRDWPEVMEQHRIKGVTKIFPSIQKPEHIRAMRKGFLNMYEVGGKPYFPLGGGVMGNGASAEALRSHDRMGNLTTELQHAWARQMGTRPARFRLLGPTTYVIQDDLGRFWGMEKTWYESKFVRVDPQMSRILEHRFSGDGENNLS